MNNNTVRSRLYQIKLFNDPGLAKKEEMKRRYQEELRKQIEDNKNEKKKKEEKRKENEAKAEERRLAYLKRKRGVIEIKTASKGDTLDQMTLLHQNKHIHQSAKETPKNEYKDVYLNDNIKPLDLKQNETEQKTGYQTPVPYTVTPNIQNKQLIQNDFPVLNTGKLGKEPETINKNVIGQNRQDHIYTTSQLKTKETDNDDIYRNKMDNQISKLYE